MQVVTTFTYLSVGTTFTYLSRDEGKTNFGGGGLLNPRTFTAVAAFTQHLEILNRVIPS